SGTRPRDGLKPYTPQNEAGIRTEPPASVPSATGPRPLATATAAPPLEPPGESSRFHGLRVIPKRGLSVTALWPNSDVVVFPRMTAPAARSRPTTTASSSGTASANSREPPVEAVPDDDAVVVGNRFGKQPRAAGRAQAASEDDILDRQRHAVQGARPAARGCLPKR